MFDHFYKLLNSPVVLFIFRHAKCELPPRLAEILKYRTGGGHLSNPARFSILVLKIHGPTSTRNGFTLVTNIPRSWALGTAGSVPHHCLARDLASPLPPPPNAATFQHRRGRLPPISVLPEAPPHPRSAPSSSRPRSAERLRARLNQHGVHRRARQGDAEAVQVQRGGPLGGGKVRAPALLEPIRHPLPAMDAVSPFPPSQPPGCRRLQSSTSSSLLPATLCDVLFIC